MIVQWKNVHGTSVLWKQSNIVNQIDGSFKFIQFLLQTL